MIVRWMQEIAWRKGKFVFTPKANGIWPIFSRMDGERLKFDPGSEKLLCLSIPGKNACSIPNSFSCHEMTCREYWLRGHDDTRLQHNPGAGRT